MATAATSPRELVFISHAAPEDNEFALWLSSKLAMAGYRVWIDQRRLRGGADFWDEIEDVLRNQAQKQIVVFSENVRKDGVKKELAIGDSVRKKIPDAKFMIPVRSTGIDFTEAPPEFLRDHIINAHPNWHDCLRELFETLEEAGIPKRESPDTEILARIVDVREEGRRFVIERKEELLSNWFPIKPPEFVRYFRFEGIQEQMQAWLKECKLPHVSMGRLAATFADPPAFSMSSSFDIQMLTDYEIPFADFIAGAKLGPYTEKRSASNDVVNVRPKVCYVGLVFKEDPSPAKKGEVCCAAQMFLNSGNGVVFRGALGPWRSVKDKQFHLRPEPARELIGEVIKAYVKDHGGPPSELFIHARQRFDDDEWAGFASAVPSETKLVGVRIRQTQDLRLFRPDSDMPVLRGTAVTVSKREGYLWSTGYIPRLRTYPGFETPKPLLVEINRGEDDLVKVMGDVLGLTKINYNACDFASGQPVTLKFADRVGEILTASPRGMEAPPMPFRFYI